MTKFADQLFADLMQEHGPTLAQARPSAAPRRHIMPRRTLLAAGAAGLGVAAAAGALVASGGTPAYAVTTNPDGTVTLAVYTESGITGANAKLRHLGDQVVIVPARPGCPAISSLPAHAVQPDGRITVKSQRGANGSITVNAQGIPAGDVIVVGVETTAHGTLTAGALTSRPAPKCISLPAPPPHSPGTGHSSGGGMPGQGGGFGSSSGGGMPGQGGGFGSSNG